MCGISGHIVSNPARLIDGQSYYEAHGLLRHRGPDDEGFIALTPDQQIRSFRGDRTVERLTNQPHIKNCLGKFSGILGHARLSIIDLTEKGHQPMTDDEGTTWIIFNGEIYNYLELKKELERLGHAFVSHSDTEVLLKGYKQWGSGVLSKLDGMWAFAVVDLKEHALFLSRDRVGMKPLYFSHRDGHFVFSSEMKFIQHRLGPTSLNSVRCWRYLEHGFLDDGSETIFEGIDQVEPGGYLIVDLASGRVKKQESFWDIPIFENNGNQTPDVTPEQFLELFKHEVQIHLRSDVPVGIALSGGLDSSAIACVTQRDFAHIINPLHTFSIIYDEESFSEKGLIAQTVNHIRSRHTWVKPDLTHILDNLRLLHAVQETPLRSMAVYAQHELMRTVAQSGVKVILGGQGADELFGGYSYYSSYLIAELLRQRHFAAAAREFGSAHQNKWDLLKALLFIMNPLSRKAGNRGKSGLFHVPDNIEIRRPEPISADIFKNILYQDLRRDCLPEYLHYEDRNSMSYSLESRLPFLGKDMLEIGVRLPNHQKLHEGIRKRLLRQAFQNVIPDVILSDKVKRGFITPQIEWQKNQMKEAMDQVFNSGVLSKLPLFNAKKVKKHYSEYQNGQNNDHDMIWRIFSFCVFYENHS